MQVIIRSPSSQLEEVVLECPGLTWNQVFCELDRLNRAGHVQLTMKGSASMPDRTPPRATPRYKTGKERENHATTCCQRAP